MVVVAVLVIVDLSYFLSQHIKDLNQEDMRASLVRGAVLV
jgi:hypothetical protein